MPDAITPVGTQNHYDPMQGINMLSGVLGLQQQRQQLQIGQGEAQKSQQSMHERQSVQQMMQSGKDDQGQSILGDDGSPDPAKILPALGRMAPLTGQQYAQNILKTHSDKIGLQEASRALDMNHRNALQGMVQSVAAGMDPKEVINTMRDYATQHPEAAATEKYMEGFVQHIGNAQDPKTRAHLAQATASMLQPGQSVETRPQNAQVQTARGSLQGAVAPPIAGGEFSASSFTPRGIGPQEEPSFQGRVQAATTAASGAGGVDNQVFSKVMSAGANSQRGIELAQKLREDVKGIRTGQYTQDFANRLTVFQQHNPGATARQMLQKDAENLKSMAEEGATSDKERDQIGGGYPSPDTMGPDAIEKASRYWEGSFKMAGARRDNAVSHVSQNGTQGLALKDSAFMKDASPGKFAPPEPKSQPQTAQAGLKSKSGRPMKKVGDHYEYAD